MLTLNVGNLVLQEKKFIGRFSHSTPPHPTRQRQARMKEEKKITEQHVPFELCHTQFPFQGLRSSTEQWPHNSLSLSLSLPS